MGSALGRIGEEALEAIATFMPDLLIVDYHLPGILGDEVCRQVRMRIDTRVIAIIMLTADDQAEVEQRSLESGADDFIPKHEDTDTLLLRVHTLLKRARSDLSILKPSKEHLRRSRLLAVDDSPTFLAYLKEELRKEAFVLHCASSAEEAMPLVECGDYDCVLVDMVMPHIDGIELCHRIDTLRQSGRINAAIIVLTADDNKVGLTRALEAGADDFVGKSSDISVLKVRIRASLRRKFYEQENQRILAELKDKELEAQRAKMESEAANVRAAMADELQQTAERLRQSNHELKQFTQVGHHQLQQPLRTVASYCQLIQQQYGSQLDEKADQFISSAIEGVGQMHALLGGLLKYSNLVSMEMDHGPVPLSDVMAEVMRRHDVQIETCGAKVAWDSLPVVYGDIEQLTVLFQELLDNSLKFRNGNAPSICINSKRMQSNAHDGDHRWQFSVQDNGIGIPAGHGDKMFEVFGRLFSSHEYPGIGIGLSVCRKIVESHGGRIRLESSNGGGASVCFDLPAA